MSGPIYGLTPWGRQAVQAMDETQRDGIQARIPEGHRIAVSSRVKSGRWIVRLVGPEFHAEVRDVGTVEYGCERVLEGVA